MTGTKTAGKIIITLTALLFVCIMPFAAYAALPQSINYQGYLTDGSGAPVNNAAQQMKFSLHDALVAGIVLWSETQTVNVQNGIYNVRLGSVTLFPVSVNFNAQYYLEVAVYNSGTLLFEALSPRQTLTSVGSAFNSDMLDGKHYSDITAVDTTLQSNIDAEAAARSAADTTLNTNTDNEAAARMAADTTLQGNIDAEAAARSNADTTLNTNINNEAAARMAADTTLQGNIDAEAAARSNADTTLNANINSEAAARITADTILQSNIDAEAAARTAADGTLQKRVTGTCPAGSSIRIISAAGTVTCETDDGIAAESDPEVGVNTTNYIPKWNGAALVSGNIYDNGANIGIGTTAPAQKLQVADGNNGGIRLGSHANWYGEFTYDYLSGDLKIVSGNSLTATGADIFFTTYGQDRAVIKGDGKVGIGTTAPADNFHVQGNMLVTNTAGAQVMKVISNYVTLGADTGGSDVNFRIMDPTINDTALLFDASLAGLYLGGGSTITAGEAGELYLYNSDGRTGASILGGSGQLILGYGSTTDVGNAGNMYVYSSDGRTGVYADGGTGQINLGYGSGTIAGDDGDLVVRSSAGTTTISLDGATGTTTTKVLTITGGADLSEQFEVNFSGKDLLPSPGMLVSIDPANPGELMLSTLKYDRKVAGIISGAGGVKTGMLMGQADSIANGANAVALTGRVYAYADASNGAIEPGDLLTTSDTPGHAMKAKDYNSAQGAIIGKAMTSLKDGKGLVLVLVTLQ